MSKGRLVIPWTQAVAELLATRKDLTPWERGFLKSLKDVPYDPTPDQRAKLREIYEQMIEA